MIQNDTRHQIYQAEMPHASRLAALAMFAIVAQLFLLASAWFLPTVSDFRLIRDNMSELVLGQFGVIQTIAFLLAGIGTLGLAYAIRQLTKGSRGSLVGSLLVAINGAGLIVVGLFPTERIDSAADVWAQGTVGTIHLVASIVCFICIIIGMFVLTWTFARDARWRSLTVWSGIFASASLPLFFAQNEGPSVGLMQRLLGLMIAGWSIVVALRIRSLARADEVSEQHE